jgi:predicted nucleotidyltransferase
MGTIIPNMGTLQSESAIKQHRTPPGASFGFADALFSSTQQKLLALLFGQPERSFYARELIGLTGSGTGAVTRELSRLVQSGLITLTSIGNQKHYRANSASPVFHELQSLVIKTFGIADKIRYALLFLEASISCAFIYGSVAKGEVHAGSDIDVMIVSGALTLGDALAVLQPLESQLGRKINPTLYTQEEYSHRVKTKNPFLSKVLAGKLIPLIGNPDAAS